MTDVCTPLPRTEISRNLLRNQPSRRHVSQASKTEQQRSRLFQRHGFDLRVRLYINGRRTALHGRTRDLSYGGASVTIAECLAIGTSVMLALRMPNSEHEVRLPAKVSHRKGSRCGLQFTALSAEQKILVQRICKALAAKPS